MEKVVVTVTTTFKSGGDVTIVTYKVAPMALYSQTKPQPPV